MYQFSELEKKNTRLLLFIKLDCGDNCINVMIIELDTKNRLKFGGCKFYLNKAVNNNNFKRILLFNMCFRKKYSFIPKRYSGQAYLPLLFSHYL